MTPQPIADFPIDADLLAETYAVYNACNGWSLLDECEDPDEIRTGRVWTHWLHLARPGRVDPSLSEPAISGDTATVFNIVNPSDRCTIIANDHEIAAMACFILGEGFYAFEPICGPVDRVPITMGSIDWFAENFGDLETRARDRAAELADCLDTFVYGDREEWAEYRALSKDPAAFDAAWAARHRTSLNDIGARAGDIAATLREMPPSDGGDDAARSPSDGGNNDDI